MCGFQSVQNQRTVLHSTSTVHVLHLLRRLTHDGMDVDIDAPSRSVLCIRCYRLLDKCIKLKRELDLAEQEAAACVRVMSDTAPSVFSEVNTPVQGSSDIVVTLWLINCHLQCQDEWISDREIVHNLR